MSDDAPKSAFELAMQRLRQKDKETDVGARPLSDAQQAQDVILRIATED
jgi:hypothetical protein